MCEDLAYLPYTAQLHVTIKCSLLAIANIGYSLELYVFLQICTIFMTIFYDLMHSLTFNCVKIWYNFLFSVLSCNI